MSTAVLINLRSRRGSQSLERTVRRFLPEAQLALTRSFEEAQRFLHGLTSGAGAELVVSGGGDGTAIGVLNEFRRQGAPLPTIGLVPLGTGNGWARATGSPSFPRAMQRLASHGRRPFPTKRFSLVEVDGTLSPWAGTGWDAEIVADYQRVMHALPKKYAEWFGGFPGYMMSLFGFTIPRLMLMQQAHVRVVNTGAPALWIDPQGRALPVPNGGTGAVLYEGPASVCGASTTAEVGLGLRAFPFAHAVPGRMAVRVYAAPTLEGTWNIGKIWRGVHPIPKDHHWLLDGCRMEFDRPVNFEVGGDVTGKRTSVDFALARETVDVLDWTRVAA
jgi:diacylglycerol kinase family enzyme